MEEKSYYELLEVPRNATTNEIRQAFRRKALEQHPDRGGDPDVFQTINKAYDVLSDPERRKYYDRTGRMERSVEEDFLEGFGRAAGSTLQKEQRQVVDDSKALQQRFAELQEQSHSQSFEAWMRSRNTSSMTVTVETLMQDKRNISEDSYEKVRLPRVRTTTVTRKSAEALRSSLGPPQVSNKLQRSPLALAAECTEVSYHALPRVLDWKECLVAVAFAPVSPLDLFVARRGADALFRDDLRIEAPHVLGNSGIGVVETVGPGVSSLAVGDWVVPARDGLGTFRSLCVWGEADVIKVPKELMPLEYMGLHRELCVAYYLMETVAADLKAGDALVINAANGAVGQVVIQLCRLMNLRAIGIVRRHDNFSDTKAWLEYLGAYKIFADDEPIVPSLKREYAALPKVGFDGVGGLATLKLIRSLAPGSTIVTYGFVGETGAMIPWQIVVHSRVTIQGFDLLDWLDDGTKKSANRKKFVQMLEQMAKLVNAGKLRISMEEIPLGQWLDALAGAEPGMNTKIVLKPLALEGERSREAQAAADLERRQKEDHDRKEALRLAASNLFLGSSESKDDNNGAEVSCYEIAPSAAPWRATLVWLHGNGELPQEYTSIFDRHLISKHPGIKVIMPTPPPQSSSMDWLALDDNDWTTKYLSATASDDLAESDIQLLKNLEAAADKVAAVVNRAREDDRVIVLAGFAQGGVVALYAALTKLADEIPHVITLGAPCVLPHFLATKIKTNLRATNIKCFAGANDDVFSCADQEAIADTLKRALPNISFHQIPHGEHEVGGLEIDALEAIFATLLPRP
ncbi:hypothetical protein CTAYLR_010195 [Chrysophaeum taylorii]|uniref:enoyl-[acyl-carrier-protein] reductase n=1 Tax=Chrysophaeum taylorii TaxID=2483200 RepID=A0AAD7UD03_9STRA|nr:hypothetical protein CTAYLR_010195 [Chrysophaeum taylorii]